MPTRHINNDNAKSESCQVGTIENIPSRHYDLLMEKKLYPSETQERFIVRFPDGMRDRIAEEAKSNNRSMNAEIVARLEQSFESPVNQAEIDGLIERLSQREQHANANLAARDRLLAITGVYLRLVINRIGESEDPVTRRLMELTGRFGDCIVHGDFRAALEVAMGMVELGTMVGVLDEQGQVRPEFEHLKPNIDDEHSLVVRRGPTNDRKKA